MSINSIGNKRAVAVSVTERDLIVTTKTEITKTPLAWYLRLSQATPAERDNFEIMPMGIHWPDLDEDLSIAGMLAGRKGV